MPKKLELEGTVEGVLVMPPGNTVSCPVDELVCFIGSGIQGDKHAGRGMVDAREVVARTIGLPKGVEIANLRQFSAVCRREVEDIAQAMGCNRSFPAGLLGENLVISGIPDFSSLPPGTQLVFQRTDRAGEYRSAILYITAENNPCTVPAKNILAWVHKNNHRLDKSGKPFTQAARSKRGVVGLVKASGKITAGDKVIAILPPAC